MSAKWHSCIAAVREPATGFRRDGSRSLRYRNHSCLIVCNSGDSLYSVLAEFKAVMLNAFVEEVEEAPAIERLCWYGNQLLLGRLFLLSRLRRG